MLVAIHQPNFLPWLGYFGKLARADLFVLLDDVQFIKRGFIHRNYIQSDRGRQRLGVPVLTKHRFDQKIAEVEINPTEPWRRKLSAQLRHAYERARFYSSFCNEIENILSRDFSRLIDLNRALLRYLCTRFGIHTPILSASELDGVWGSSTQRLVTICKSVGASDYLSGSGGKNYQDEQLFRDEGVGLVYTTFRHPTYRQVRSPFAANLSAIDLLFNEGPKSGEILFAANAESTPAPATDS